MLPTNHKFGHYNTTKILELGEQRATYEAFHHETKQRVILRVMLINIADIENAQIRCSDILLELSQLDMPNAVKIIDYGFKDNLLYIITPFLGGGTLRERIQQDLLNTPNPKLPSISEVLKLSKNLATTLDKLHQIGVVHGQLEPRNIVFDDRGHVFLAEIGFTRIFKIIYNLQSTNSFTMTYYSAPELWRGERPSPATDQYALACIVYHLLTGKLAFNGSTLFSLMQAHIDDIAEPPHHIREDLPQDLAMIFWQALAKPTDRRYQNVTAFYQDLKYVLDDGNNV